MSNAAVEVPVPTRDAIRRVALASIIGSVIEAIEPLAEEVE